MSQLRFKILVLIVAAAVGITIAVLIAGNSGPNTSAQPTTDTTSVEISTTLTTSITTTTTTTTSLRPRTPPRPAGEVANWLNELYKGFDENDATSPLGVTLWMRDDWVVYCGMGCHPDGLADCRISTSILNHKVMLKKNANQVAVTMDRKSGVIFNQTAVDGWLGKCSYIWDGATNNRYNNGCGGVSPCNPVNDPDICKNPASAYMNICPSTGSVCSGSDPEVLKDWHVTRGSADCPHRTTDNPCYWKGGSFDGPRWDEVQERWVDLTTSEMREMMKFRLERQQGAEPEIDPTRNKKEYHTEVVIDGKLMLHDLHWDPALVVPAFIYTKGHSIGRGMAVKMRDDFCNEYSLDQTPPLIQLDHACDVSQPNCPFSPG